MLKKSLWYIIAGTALAGFIVLAGGFYQAILVTSMVSPPPAAESPVNETPEDSALTAKNSNTIRLLILGDSVAKGTGDEKSKGFAGYLPEDFKNDTPKEILVDNAGIDGLESMGLLEQLKSPKLNESISKSDIILISIGGNDIRSILSLNSLAKDDAFKVRLDSYLNSMKQIILELRNSNPDSILIFLGLYNPYAKLTSLDDSRLLNTWNYNTQQLVAEDGKAIFIPTQDLVKYNLERYIARDGLHPNSAGYQAISNRISQSLKTIITAY